MLRNSLGSVLHYLHRLSGPGGSGEAKDAELLDRFVRHRDEAAFELLVWRHGPMVLGLCRRLLRHEQDSEDAFQATFFALARRAAAIAKKEALASWLYKVAYRIACRAPTGVPVFSNHGAIVDNVPAPEMEADLVWRDLRPVLDQEVARLPESYRRVLILCYLEGKTHEEAARLLGCPKGTVASQLARARERLRRRFTQRGWALSSSVLAAVMTTKAMAGAVPAELAKSTLRAALAYASGNTGVILSARAVALTEGVLHMLWLNKLKMTAGVLVAVLLTATGVGLAVRHTWAGGGKLQVVQAQPLANKPVPQAGIQGDPKAEIAELRAEIVKLRLSLEAALKEIKNSQAGAPQDRGALYQGKPKQYWMEQFRDTDPQYRETAVQALGALAQNDKELVRFWIEQCKDADPKYREEAVHALGRLTRKDKQLIPVLVTALKDEDEGVGEEAYKALGAFGPEVIPQLLEALKDKRSPTTRSRAATALRSYRSDAKEAVPLLVQALQDEDRRLRGAAVTTLGQIGPEAKPSIPALIDLMGRALQSMDSKGTAYVQLQPRTATKSIGTAKKKGTAKSFTYVLKDQDLPEIIVRSLFAIDPENRNLIDPDGDRFNPFGGPRSLDPSEVRARLQVAYETLKKKYQKEK